MSQIYVPSLQFSVGVHDPIGFDADPSQLLPPFSAGISICLFAYLVPVQKQSPHDDHNDHSQSTGMGRKSKICLNIVCDEF